MTRIPIITSMFVALLASGGCPDGERATTVEASMSGPRSTVSLEYFHGQLSPYGRWIDYAGYGWCWSPNAVPVSWRPYSDGYWVYSDVGWTWVSNEPWGWATYHYGRWLADPYYGWVWVPGPVWAPAWVAWRMDDAWVGWAPLPPEASWGAGTGLRFANVERIPSERWCFVPRDRIADRDLRDAIAPVGRSRVLVDRTRDVTRFESAGGRPLNRGPAVEVVERHLSRPLPHLRVQDVGTPERGRGQAIGERGVGFFRPEIRRRDSRESRAPDDDRREQPRKQKAKGDSKRGRPEREAGAGGGDRSERGERRQG